LQENMKMEQLEYFGIPSYIIQIWKKYYSSILLPVQEKAVRQYNLLQTSNIRSAGIKNQTVLKNLLIISPSSSGKTLAGEIPAMQEISLNKKIIFLVPLRILAEEKYRHFLNLYRSIGLKVKLSSRDHRHDDRDIIRGHFHVAVIVYEKFYYLLLQYPQFLKSISLLIADEIQLIDDIQRGPRLEKMYKYLQFNHQNIRIIGLSAFMENIMPLAELLNAKTVFSAYRPVELRKGIVRKGIYQYIEHNTGITGKETFFPEDSVSECNLAGYLKATLNYLAKQNETNLVFFPTRREVRTWSKWLASQFSLPPARRAIDELYSMEHTTSQKELIELLQNGIAYHCANLSWQERHLIEKALRSGNIKIICATDTLSMGINLPVNNVILTGQKVVSGKAMEKSYSTYYRRELALSEVENMGGRAGRFDKKNRFGRIIFLAPSLIELTAYQKLYFGYSGQATLPLYQNQFFQISEQSFQVRESHPACLKIKPVKTRENLLNFLLHNIVLECYGHNIDNIFSILLNEKEKQKNSFWNYQFPNNLGKKEILLLLDEIAEEQLIRICNRHSFHITDMGRLVVSKGISFNTFVHFRGWLKENALESLNELEIIFLVAESIDGRKLLIPYPYSAQGKWKEYLRMRFLNMIFEQGINHKPIFQMNLNKDPEHKTNQTKNENLEKYLTIKKTLLMFDWLSNKKLKEIEEEYGILSGSIQKIGEDFSWLVDTLAAIAGKSGWKEQRPSDLKKISLLSERLVTGVSPEGLALARLKIPGLTRGYIQRLVQEGYDSEGCLRELDRKQLHSLLPERLIDRIQNYLFSKYENLGLNRIDLPKRQNAIINAIDNSVEKTKPVISINPERPDRIFFFEKTISVNRISFQLISILGKNQGKMLSYDEIINFLWPDDEDATYHRLWYHLGKLRYSMQKIIQEKNISKLPNNYIKEKIIKVFPGRGLLLDEDVLVKIYNTNNKKT